MMKTLGLDIGGTKTRAILWNGKRVIRSRGLPTPKTKNTLIKNIRSLISRLDQKNQATRVGIGVAGVIRGSTLRFAPNIPHIRNLDFKKVFPRRALRVDNDARCFGRAEYLLGAGRGTKNILAFTIGTGIGRAYGKNGKIQKVKKFEYPEPWEKHYQVIRNHIIGRKKDERKLIQCLGTNLASIIRRFAPGAVVIGGGVIEKRKNFFQKLKRELRKRGVSSTIRLSRLGKDAAAIGAAVLFSTP